MTEEKLAGYSFNGTYKKRSRKIIYAIILAAVIIGIVAAVTFVPGILKQKMCIAKHSGDYKSCLAVKEGNVAGCEGNSKNMCEFMIITHKAVVQNNSRICQQLEGVQYNFPSEINVTFLDVCELVVAQNSSVCAYIDTETERKYCEDLILTWGKSFAYTFEPSFLRPVEFYHYLAVFDKVECSFLKNIQCSASGETGILDQALLLRSYPPFGYHE